MNDLRWYDISITYGPGTIESYGQPLPYPIGIVIGWQRALSPIGAIRGYCLDHPVTDDRVIAVDAEPCDGTE